MVEDKSASFGSTDAGKKEQARQALQLSQDMTRVREEEIALSAAGASHQVQFKLHDAGDATVQALRSIIAARAFEGKMLGCKGSAALEALPEAGEGGEEAAQVSGEEKDTPVIELRETQEAAVQDAIGYAYSGVLHVRDDNWKELLGAAHAMGMQGAKEFIEAFLRQPGKVNTGNVCDVLSCAQKNSAEGLQEYCMSVIDANSSAVFANAAFTMLPKIVVQELMKRDTLVTDELSIFKAVLAWGKARLEVLAREQQEKQASVPEGGVEEAEGDKAGGDVTLGTALDGVIDHVRFPLIPPEHLRDVVQPALAPQKEGDKPVAETLILEGYQHHALVRIGQQSKVDASKTRPRAGAQRPLGEKKADVVLEDAIVRAQRTGRWLRSLPHNVQRISMASMKLCEDDAVLLGDFLKTRGRSLIELDLKCNYLTSTSLAHILSSLPDCPCLQGLALGDNPLGSEAGGILGAAISTSCASLQKLGLGGTNLGDVGVLALAPCLAAHGALKVVGLSANGVSVKGARELMEVLKGSQTIDTVVLGGNAFSQADAVMLQDMCRSGMSLKMA